MTKDPHDHDFSSREPVKAPAPPKASPAADLKIEAPRLCEELAQLQHCGNFTAEQQALLTAALGKAKGLAEKINHL